MRTVPKLIVAKFSPWLIVVPGRRAHLGVGFLEKSEAFDFNAAIDLYFRYVEWRSGNKLL